MKERRIKDDAATLPSQLSPYPKYIEPDSAEARIAKCIRFELDHGGDELAAARAVLRDIERGFICLPKVVHYK